MITGIMSTEKIKNKPIAKRNSCWSGANVRVVE
jgi:hypothetical protein